MAEKLTGWNKFKSFSNSNKGYMTNFAIDMAAKGASGIQNARNASLGDLARPDDGALAIKDAQYAIAKSIPGPVGMIAGIAGGVDNILGSITGGLGSATGIDRAMTAIPLLGNTAAIFARKTKSFKGDIADINTGDFGGTVAAAQEAKSASGGKSLAARKVNRMIDEAQNQFDMATDIVERNKKLRNNNISQDILARTTNKYAGNQQTYSLVGKKGMIFPNLDYAKNLLLSKETVSDKQEIQQFRSGGKIEKDNIIPTGAMHKNLHHIEENNPELEGQITKKGIPVGIFDEDGKFEQIAEVESGELIIDLKHTKYIEDLHNEYKITKDENIVINCGKFIVSQIFSNTKDEDKVIKNTNE